MCDHHYKATLIADLNFICAQLTINRHIHVEHFAHQGFYQRSFIRWIHFVQIQIRKKRIIPVGEFGSKYGFEVFELVWITTDLQGLLNAIAIQVAKGFVGLKLQ